MKKIKIKINDLHRFEEFRLRNLSFIFMCYLPHPQNKHLHSQALHKDVFGQVQTVCVMAVLEHVIARWEEGH